MLFLNLDDNYPDHPKVEALSDGAFRLHTSALCYCVAYETDWVIRGTVASRLTPKFRSKHLSELVDAALWEVCGSFDYRILSLWSYGSGRPLWRYTRSANRPKIPDELRQAVYDRDGRACLHCGATEHLSLDHIHPFSRGGGDTFENLQTLCQPCNSRKGARV